MKAVEIVIVVSVMFILVLIFDYKLDKNYVPGRIKSFCQATHEVYGSSYDECINQYRTHKGTK